VIHILRQISLWSKLLYSNRMTPIPLQLHHSLRSIPNIVPCILPFLRGTYHLHQPCWKWTCKDLEISAVRGTETWCISNLFGLLCPTTQGVSVKWLRQALECGTPHILTFYPGMERDGWWPICYSATHHILNTEGNGITDYYMDGEIVLKLTCQGC
jgi:hypothetical protein